MIYLYAIVAGASDVLAGWFALRTREDRLEARYIIAFAAGVLLAVTFIYVAAGDLLPEAHRKFNWKVVPAVLGGMAVMLAIKRLIPGA